MRRRRAVLVALVVLLVAGCAVRYATGPRLAAAPAPDFASDDAVLYVFRERAEPRAYAAHFDVDGDEAVTLAERGFTWIYLSPGRHDFVFRWPWTATFVTAPPRVRFSERFEAGRTYVFSLRASSEPRVVVVERRAAVVGMETRAGLEAIRICCSYVAPTRRRFGGRA